MADEHVSRSVPWLPQLILAFFAGAEHRDAVLGDLEEEYHRHHESTGFSATRWYWKQVFRAIPGLTTMAIRNLPVNGIALTLLVTVTGYLFLIIWGQFVTRALLNGVLDVFPASQSIDLLYLYIPIRIVGIFLVAALISLSAFNAAKTFQQNFGQMLGPLLLLMILPSLFNMLSAGEDYSIGTGMLMLGIDGLSLLCGAILGGWIKQRRVRK